MTLEQELRTVWEKYAPQREAETKAVEVSAKARAELGELNARRTALGLPTVGEFTIQGLGGYQVAQTWPLPKTWRDEMDAELLSTVKRWLAQ